MDHRFDVAALRSTIARTAQLLDAHAEQLDAINVFPVADDDTGSNLSATIDAVVEALDEASDDEAADVIATAGLRGALGNSGTILSQVLRGLAETVDERGPLGPEGLAAAFDRASEYAYLAIQDPVEGTMLTAVEAAADAAHEAVAEEVPNAPDVLRHVEDRVHRAVERTTDQLEELREAGVVDAGARGFELLCRVMLAVATDEELRDETTAGSRSSSGRSDPASSDPQGRFEVQYVVEGAEREELEGDLTPIAASVVVASDGQRLRVHAHADEHEQIVEAGRRRGTVSELDVTDLREQT